MAIHASPGVYFEVLDFSMYAPRLSKTILALVGKAERGPTVPTFISSVRQFVDTFGVPRKHDYSALAAISYLEFGSALWFRRLTGSNSTRSSAVIPKALEIYDENVTVADNTGSYIFSGKLNYQAVPGTVEIVIANPEDPSNSIIIQDDESGNFSPYTNLSISNFPNYIDYDSGDFRFTIDEVAEKDSISVVYNTKDVVRSNEVHDTGFNLLQGTDSFVGMLNYGNVLSDTVLALNVVGTKAGANTTYTVVTGITEVTSPETIALELKNPEDLKVADISIDAVTGSVAITFIDDIAVVVPDTVSVTATYTNRTFKTKLLGSVGTGTELKHGFIDTLNTSVVPGSVQIFKTANETSTKTLICTDNSQGKFVSANLKAVTNSIDYDSGEFSIALVTPPADGNKVTANYLAKYNQTLFTAVEETASGTISGQLSMKPVIRNSVTVKAGDNVFEDDGEGFLIGNGGNGTIDYETGYINLNYSFSISAEQTVEANWLAKFGSVVTLHQGNVYDGTTLEFYKDPYFGYGVKVWGPEQNDNQTPLENWKDIDFTNPDSTRYFTSKVASRLIYFVIDDDTGAVPLLNSKIRLYGGDNDDANINEASVLKALDEFSNSESIDINLIAAPDFAGEKSVINKLITLCEAERGDSFAIIDPPQNLTVQQAVEWHNGDGQWANENALNSSHAALYYPWIQIYNQFTESLQWVPPSVKIVSVYAYSDSVSEVWFAPAGLNRGRLFTTEKVEKQLNASDRDYLYNSMTNSINPIVNFVGDGIVVYGQKTLQRKPSSTDRVNVMRLLLYIKKILATAVKYLLFEPNDELTWILYRQLVEPLVEDIRRRRGLYEFKVICDKTTNTAFDIDNNTMVGEIWLKPTKTTERIINRFILTSSGVDFDEMRRNS